MADLPSPHPLRDLFDAAARGYAVKLTCWNCKHVRVLHAHALWWMFHKRGWPDRFKDLRSRCVCVPCRAKRRMIIRNPELELVREEITGEPLPLPPEGEWKRELGRRR